MLFRPDTKIKAYRQKVQALSNKPESTLLNLLLTEACFKRSATAVPNSIDRIKFNLSMAVARRLKPRYTAVARLGFKRSATAMPNSIYKL